MIAKRDRLVRVLTMRYDFLTIALDGNGAFGIRLSSSILRIFFENIKKTREDEIRRWTSGL